MNTNAKTEVIDRNNNDRLRGARSEVRTEKVREKQFEPFKPRGSQDIPAALEARMNDAGYTLYWGRILLEGETDSANLADLAYKGYEPVDVSDVPENVKRTLQFDDIAGFRGLIVSKDTALFKIPTERYDEIRNHFRGIADSQIRSVNDAIRDNAKTHGLDVKLYDESESKVAYGKSSRKVVAQDDSDEK